MVKLGIVEKIDILVYALKEELCRSSGIEVVGTASNIQEAMGMMQQDKPDVLLLGPSFSGKYSFDLLGIMRNSAVNIPVLILGAHDEPIFAAHAITAGAKGYLYNSASLDGLIYAINAVSRGEKSIPPGAEGLLASVETHPAHELTAREREVMEMLACGMTNREIAGVFKISVKTIDTHRGHILKKLGLRNNSELTTFAIKHGYVGL